MAVSSTDITFLKSTIGDSAGGGATATVITNNVKNNLWPDLSDVERAAGGTRYRKVFIANNHITDSLATPKVWIEPDAPGFVPTALGLGFDDTDDDTAAQGTLVALGANAQIELSSTAADTRNAMLVGLNALGVPVIESIALNGSTAVLSVGTFSKLFGVLLDSEHGTNTVTLKQGTGGATLGTIGPNLSATFLWVTANSEANALLLPNLVAGARWGIWMRQQWSAGVLPQRPSTPVLRLKEGS